MNYESLPDHARTAALLQRVLGELPMAVLLCKAQHTPDGRVKDFTVTLINQAAARLTGRPVQTLTGKTLRELYAPYHFKSFFIKLLRVYKTGQPCTYEQFMPSSITPENTNSWYTLIISKFDDGIMITAEDSTLRKEHEEAIKSLAYRDELTGLYNRRYFFEHVIRMLALARRRGWSVALVYFDIDNFKEINDNYGHPVGDELLREVAARLTPAIRREDLLIRMGGDEFALFMPDTPHDKAVTAAKRIIKTLGPSFELSAGNHQVKVSIGVAIQQGDNSSLEELLRQADVAMYQAKTHKNEQNHEVEVYTPDSKSVPDA